MVTKEALTLYLCAATITDWGFTNMFILCNADKNDLMDCCSLDESLVFYQKLGREEAQELLTPLSAAEQEQMRPPFRVTWDDLQVE